MPESVLTRASRAVVESLLNEHPEPESIPYTSFGIACEAIVHFLNPDELGELIAGGRISSAADILADREGLDALRYLADRILDEVATERLEEVGYTSKTEEQLFEFGGG